MAQETEKRTGFTRFTGLILAGVLRGSPSQVSEQARRRTSTAHYSYLPANPVPPITRHPEVPRRTSTALHSEPPSRARAPSCSSRGIRDAYSVAHVTRVHGVMSIMNVMNPGGRRRVVAVDDTVDTGGAAEVSSAWGSAGD